MTHRLKTAFFATLIAVASTGAFASEPAVTQSFINHRTELARQAGLIITSIGNGLYSIELADKPFSIAELVTEYPKTAAAISTVMCAVLFSIGYWYAKKQNQPAPSTKQPAEQNASCCATKTNQQ